MDKNGYITFATSDFTSSWLKEVSGKSDKSIDELINCLIDKYLAEVETAYDVELKIDELYERSQAV